MGQDYVRRVEPVASDLRVAAWPGGGFATGRRDRTPEVEGVIRTPEHVLFSTLEGGARRLSVRTDCGHRFEGPDTAGRLSLAPADRERRLALSEVRAAWASLSLDTALIDDLAGGAVTPRPFTNLEDPFTVAVLRRLAEDQASEEGIDPLFGESVSVAVGLRLLRRERLPERPVRPERLTPARLKRVADYVETAFAGPIRVADLARVAGLSEGQFHRAFRATAGLTPMAFVTGVRMRRATELLMDGPAGIAEVALSVGYQSPSRFARAFRRAAGVRPSDLRP